jgi:hypothetical protein
VSVGETGNEGFIDEALRRLMEAPPGLQTVLEGLARLPAAVAQRLLRELGAQVPVDFLEAALFWPDESVCRAAVRALEARRSVRARLALEHRAGVTPAWVPAAAAAERMAALQTRGQLAPWSTPWTFCGAAWSLPDAEGGSTIIVSARDAQETRLLVARLDARGALTEAAGQSIDGSPERFWKQIESLPLSAPQVHSVLLEAERVTIERVGALPAAYLAWQSLRWSAAPAGSRPLEAFARELQRLSPFRATYASDHPCADCAALNGKRLTVLGAADQDPHAGIACRVSLGASEDLAPLSNLRVGTNHPARALLNRYAHWCREHLIE